MRNSRAAQVMMPGIVVLLVSGCDPERASPAGASSALLPPQSKALPRFPLAYRGAGRFVEVGNPRNHLVAFYEFDMTRGSNRERVHYIDRVVEIFNLYDLGGQEPDREYFIHEDPATRQRTCTRQRSPLPRIFSRDWWLSNDMVYQGTETINGFQADCWAGHDKALDRPLRFCNRANAYPDFAPLLKKVGSFEFHDYKGAAIEPGTRPTRHFELPPECSAR